MHGAELKRHGPPYLVGDGGGDADSTDYDVFAQALMFMLMLLLRLNFSNTGVFYADRIRRKCRG
jgi:hypothetical protein